MKHQLSVHPCLLVLILIGTAGGIASGQTENPLQPSVKAITAPAPVQGVNANLVPLIWKADVNGTIVSIPLRNIEFFGVQAYIVDGATRVRELTISTHAQSMIRIYHIRPLDLTETANAQVERLRKFAEGRIDEDTNQPVKVFPMTTHAHMVEYRVTKEDHVDALHDHLEKVMIEYHARELIEDLRPDIVRTIKIGE
ncbi:MAG: hypothetical protein JNJ70_23870 [Verrucomicrobiales bacterium]|nr:hypothetical protein [Verrucomicrobiales bacterium]